MCLKYWEVKVDVRSLTLLNVALKVYDFLKIIIGLYMKINCYNSVSIFLQYEKMHVYSVRLAAADSLPHNNVTLTHKSLLLTEI